MADVFERGEAEIEAIQSDPLLTPAQKRANIRAIEIELGEIEQEEMERFQ